MPIVIELLHQYCKLLDATDQKMNQVIPLTKEALEELNNHVVLSMRGGSSMKIDAPMLDMHTIIIDGYTLSFVDKETIK